MNQGKRKAIELGRQAMEKTGSRKRHKAGSIFQNEEDDEADGEPEDDERASTASPTPSTTPAQNSKQPTIGSDESGDEDTRKEIPPKKTRRAKPITHQVNQEKEMMATYQPQAIPGPQYLQPQGNHNIFALGDTPEAIQNKRPSASSARIEYGQNSQARFDKAQINLPQFNGIHVSKRRMKDGEQTEGPKPKRAKREKGTNADTFRPQSSLNRRPGSQHLVAGGLKQKPQIFARSNAPRARKNQRPNAPSLHVGFGQNHHGQFNATQAEFLTGIHPAQTKGNQHRQIQVNAIQKQIRGIETY